MRDSDIEPGGIYLFSNGQEREVIWFQGRTLRYRMITLGYSPAAARAKLPQEGYTRDINKHKFRQGILGEIE